LVLPQGVTPGGPKRKKRSARLFFFWCGEQRAEPVEAAFPKRSAIRNPLSIVTTLFIIGHSLALPGFCRELLNFSNSAPANSNSRSQSGEGDRFED
jgi:hypothetical protein